MEPQYFDQYGSWYQIIEGDLHYCPAMLDGSQDSDENAWGPVEDIAAGLTWEEAIEFLNAINERFTTRFKLASFGYSRMAGSVELFWETRHIAPKILHIWHIDLQAKPIYRDLVISTVHGFLEVNTEFSPDEMMAINLLEVGQMYSMGVHAGWVRIERVQ
jgi:hypothetical protein